MKMPNVATESRHSYLKLSPAQNEAESRDAVVETAIEGPKLTYPDRSTAFETQIRYRLTQIAVVGFESRTTLPRACSSLSFSTFGGALPN